MRRRRSARESSPSAPRARRRIGGCAAARQPQRGEGDQQTGRRVFAGGTRWTAWLRRFRRDTTGGGVLSRPFSAAVVPVAAARYCRAESRIPIKCRFRAADASGASETPGRIHLAATPIERIDPMNVSQTNRRRVLGACAALAFGASLVGSGAALAQQKLKVAAIYTVPVEQQWVSPHPQGAERRRGARRDRVRVLRERQPTPTTSA